MLPFLLSSSLPCLYCMPKPCFLIPQAKQKPWKYMADTMEIHQCTSAIAVPTLSQAVSLQLPCMEEPHRLISIHIEQTGSYDDTECEAVKQKWKKKTTKFTTWKLGLNHLSTHQRAKSVELDHFTLYTYMYIVILNVMFCELQCSRTKQKLHHMQYIGRKTDNCIYIMNPATMGTSEL